MTDERTAETEDFLSVAGWADAQRYPLAGDASTRRYVRLVRGDRTAMLMDQPKGKEAPQAPADATAEQRHALGYNASARLAAGDVGRFVAVADFLKRQGLSAPGVYHANPARGFALLEDLGDNLYVDALAGGEEEHGLYLAATDALSKLHENEAPSALAADMPLFPYDEVAQLAEIDLMTDWFIPFALKRKASANEISEHRDLWRAALDGTRKSAVFVHRDYHAQNLLWLPDRSGIARVGLIDFQDALAGSPAQDLMHLIEDARRDVPPDVAAAVVARYVESAKRRDPAFDEAAFRAEMAVISGQRNARIIGVFARLFERDGKPKYLSFLPRVWRHLSSDLAHPALGELKAWYDRVIPVDSRSVPDGAIA